LEGAHQKEEIASAGRREWRGNLDQTRRKEKRERERRTLKLTGRQICEGGGGDTKTRRASKKGKKLICVNR